MRVRWLLFLFLACPLLAQTKHPFTFEDMMALKRVEEPVVSPDGKWVLFAAVDVDLNANTKTPHVWVVGLNQDSGSHVSQNRGDMGQSSVVLIQISSPSAKVDSRQNHFAISSGNELIHFVQHILNRKRAAAASQSRNNAK